MKYTRRRRQPKRRTRGGKRLGEGASGFVVKPAIPCVGKDVSKKVSKIFKHKSFSELKGSLEPVITKLRTLDPEQLTFLYPEFCDAFGDLTDELRADGITETNKTSSYLLNYGGVTYDSLFYPLFGFCNQIFIDKKKYIKRLQEALPEEPPEKWFSEEEYIIAVYNSIAPLVHKIELDILRLHEAGMVHGDIHGGNILLETKDKLLKNWSNLVLQTIDEIKQSHDYKTLGYVNISQAITILGAIKELKTINLLKFNTTIIDWDDAIMLNDIEDPEERIELQNEERNVVIENLLPQGGIFGRFSEKYYEDYN